MSGKFSEKIPSFVWILIIVGGIALFIGAILGFFYGLSFVEGFASVLLLAGGWGAFRAGNNSPNLESSSFGIALVISFFALMGMSLDQPGNYVYNKPMQWIFCPADSRVERGVISTGTHGGRGVSVSQNFNCVSETDGEILRKISTFEQLAFRFFEYVLLGYILLGLSRLYTKVKSLLKAGRKPSARV